jgi:DNA sulfur modification protein DndC
MAKSSGSSRTQHSAFEQYGFRKTIERHIAEIQQLYRSDSAPWIIGYSGGKDSTATLQLVWTAIKELPESDRTKPVHVISTDTLVENPIVAQWVKHSIDHMVGAAEEQGLASTIFPHRLTPAIEDSFWVNLVGKGYPAPRPKFRWCTSRLKINPSNKFINDLVRTYGETILVLGTRKAESSVRSANMKKYEALSTRELLSVNGNIPGSWIYTPIGAWTNDDVWMYIVQERNPWGHNNQDLLTMYQGATADGECPLVVDTGTPSCGDSRFGCYVCTMVDQDKSMSAMIQNDSEKDWMYPLMQLRNEWLDTDDRSQRDFRRMNGSLLWFNDRLVHGPYKQRHRERILRAILKAQNAVRKNAPKELTELELISIDELDRIRRIWVSEKGEIEDSLPRIYEEETGLPYPGPELDSTPALAPHQIELLERVCSELDPDDETLFSTIRELLAAEHWHRTKVRRAGLFDDLWSILVRGAFRNGEEAAEFARERDDLKRESSRSSTESLLVEVVMPEEVKLHAD